MIIALISAQSSNLKKIAKYIPKVGKTDSHYRRLQRFIADAVIDYDQLAMLIYRLFGLNKVTLTIDRTNWQWGKSNINIFMLGVVYQGIAIPLYWDMLDKRGNSSHLERCKLIERFIKQFGENNIEMILADREFVGEKWFNWLTANDIPFAIRIKKNSKVMNHHGKLVQIKDLFRHLTTFETYRHGRILTIDGCPVRVFAKRDKEHGLVIVATNQLETIDAMTIYAKRWEIESLFACLKGRGFNLEDTHLTKMDRVSKLVAVNALAFCWAYHIGIHKEKDKPLKRKLGGGTKSMLTLNISIIDIKESQIKGFKVIIKFFRKITTSPKSSSNPMSNSTIITFNTNCKELANLLSKVFKTRVVFQKVG